MFGIKAIIFFCKKFFVSDCRKIFWGYRSLLSFRKIPVVKVFMKKRGGGRDNDFLSRLFYLTVLNLFVEEPFCVSESSGFRKISCLRGQRKIRHAIEKFLCHSIENLVKEHFCVLKKTGITKLFGQERGEGKEVLSNFSFEKFCLAAEKFRSGNLQCATDFW